MSPVPPTCRVILVLFYLERKNYMVRVSRTALYSHIMPVPELSLLGHGAGTC